MWHLDNQTPFAAERAWLRDLDGSEIWIVLVKATFDIGPDGMTQVAREQLPVLRAAEHYGDPATTSVRYDSDVVLRKARTDVIVNGHACAPANKTVTRTTASFRVGSLFKELRVVGDRKTGSLGTTSAEPFEIMPIVYERAYGGAAETSLSRPADWDVRNPVGVGFSAVQDRAVRGFTLPNIESDVPRTPAGFGAVAAHWQPRARHAGTYGDDWMRRRRPLLPDDFDERYFQSAPEDQQSNDFLTGGEPVELVNLTRTSRLSFRLPRVHLGFETFFSDGRSLVHPTRTLHTVIIEPDHPRVILVWHSALSCHHLVYKLQRTEVLWKRDLRRGPTGSVGDADV